MKILDEFRRDSQRVLDRLVDGELGVNERRELLAAMDDEIGGWRRCALAFLEAQSWRRQMTRAAAESTLVPAAAATPAPPRRAAFWGSALAIAASLAVAFVLGRQFSIPGTLVGPSLAQDERTQPPQPSDPLPQTAIAQPHGADERPWETITLTPVGGSGAGDPINLRVAKDGESAVGATRGALSKILSRSFEKQGWQVNRQQRTVPIDLSDGRRLEVPVEEINLRSPQHVQF
jgi:hypothetical protein